MEKFWLALAAFALVFLCSSEASATANFVYHEQTANFVATPTCPSGGTDASCGRYVENTDRSGSAGFQIFSPESYTLHFKIEFQFFTNQLRVYYTTDGSNPSGSFGTPFGTTQVAIASFTCTYSDQTQGCQIVDVGTGVLPPQSVGTTVKYIVGAWHSGGGPEVFGNSGTCSGCFSCTDSTTGCATVNQYNVLAAPATPLVISEYRLRGTGGAEDEYVEIFNTTNSAITVDAFDLSAGFAVAASDGIVRCTIPNGTTIPALGHYLCVNSDGYSLSTYPAGTSTTATGDATYTTDIADLPPGAAGCTGTLVSGRGIALFNTANTANFSTATRFDAAGSVCETNTLYKEGTGHPVVNNGANTQNAWVRDSCGKSGNPATFGPCPSNGAVVDNNNNATDFFFVDTDGLPLGPPQKLGAPGPENLSSPRLIDSQFGGFLLDATKSSSQAPNRFRNTADTGTNKTFGTMELRRRIVNNTGGNVTRLRFRVIDTTTFPPVSGSGRADLRALTSTDLLVGPVNDAATCAAVQAPPSTSSTAPCSVTVRGLTLETPPLQPNGGGFNSSLSADSVTITPLAPGESINIRILLGVQATGNFRFLLTVEALP